MKKTFLLLPLLAIILNSCHKAEDKGRLVSSIDFVGSDYTARYEYDTRNRLIKIGDAYANYTYPSAKTIVITKNTGDVDTLTLNKEGNVVSAVYNKDNTTTYTYFNGFLTKIETVGGRSNHTSTLTWDNGNIRTIGSSSSNSWETYTFEYDSTLNKSTSLDIFFLAAGNIKIKGDLSFGLFGKSCQYLPSKVMFKDKYRFGASDNTYVTTYRYETDSDGYVTNIYVKDERSHDAEERLRYIIEYK